MPQLRALLWWIDRWRKSTAYTDMTLEEQGAFRNLLDECTLRGGPLPTDERILAKACGDALAWPRVREAVIARFEACPDGLRNKTHDDVYAETVKNLAQKSAAGKAGAAARWGVPKHDTAIAPPLAPSIAPVMAAPMQSGSGSGSKSKDQERNAREAFAGKRIRVPRFLDNDFVSMLGNRPFDLTAWYRRVDAELTRSGETVDVIPYLRQRFKTDAKIPTPNLFGRDKAEPINAVPDAEETKRRSDRVFGRVPLTPEESAQQQRERDAVTADLLARKAAREARQARA